MGPLYAHRQVGREILVGLGIGLLLNTIVLLGVILVEPGIGALIAAAVLVLLGGSMFLFGSLTVEVTSSEVRLRFGPGAFRKRFDVGAIRAVQAVRNPWTFGWGIHLTPRGWLYNVGGSEAVEIELANGRRFRIGTDEPAALASAIRQAAGLDPLRV